MKEEPGPVTGEWTVAYDNMLYAGDPRDSSNFLAIIRDDEGRNRIVSAHNAALAAEKLKVYEAVSQEKAVVISEVIKLREQLAAEIGASASKARLYEEQLDAASVQVRQLQTQLAAVKASFSTMLDVEKKLRKELAAERQEGIDFADKQYYGISGLQRIRNLEQQLAAEREKRRIDLEHILDLERTIDAEREKHPMEACRNPLVENKELIRDNKQLRAQLAAAQAQIVKSRELLGLGYDLDVYDRELTLSDRTALDEAIAEATKPLTTANLRLVDALKEARLFCNTEGRYRIDDVLAKAEK